MHRQLRHTLSRRMEARRPFPPASLGRNPSQAHTLRKRIGRGSYAEKKPPPWQTPPWFGHSAHRHTASYPAWSRPCPHRSWSAYGRHAVTSANAPQPPSSDTDSRAFGPAFHPPSNRGAEGSGSNRLFRNRAHAAGCGIEFPSLLSRSRLALNRTHTLRFVQAAFLISTT